MNDFWQRYYGQLEGCTITGIRMRGEWPILILNHPYDGEIEIEVWQDPEGNGPGFLYGLPRPEPKAERRMGA